MSLVFFLADDDEDDRMLFSEALVEINPSFECIMAKNGEEALFLLNAGLFELPDYIFLDLNMPLMNGLQCLAEIKKSSLLKNIPVVIYSTASRKEYEEESMKLGAMNFFIKPSDYRGLLQYLRNILNN